MNATTGTTTVHATKLHTATWEGKSETSLITLCGAETRHSNRGIGSRKLRETLAPVTCKVCAKRMHTTD